MTTHDETTPVPNVAAQPPSFPGEVFRGRAFQGPPAAPFRASTFDVSGTFQLTQTSSYLSFSYGSFTTGSSCSGSGGYSDIDTGSSVTVYDGSGAVVATGMLGSGRASSSSTCEFAVTVPNVPAGSDFYQVEVSHRGKVTVEGRRLETDGVSLTLGS
jgi:hypothetical protein